MIVNHKILSIVYQNKMEELCTPFIIRKSHQYKRCWILYFKVTSFVLSIPGQLGTKLFFLSFDILLYIMVLFRSLRRSKDFFSFCKSENSFNERNLVLIRLFLDNKQDVESSFTSLWLLYSNSADSCDCVTTSNSISGMIGSEFRWVCISCSLERLQITTTSLHRLKHWSNIFPMINLWFTFFKSPLSSNC